ncbi:transposase [bacterium]|nr:transposase [bacterium]
MNPRRIREPGYYFHVTARGNNRQDIFQTNEDKVDYVRRIGNIFPASQIRLLCAALMTNHVHLLVQDVLGGGLPPAMQRLQGGYAQAWNHRHRRTGHVYGARYHAEPVESEAHLIYGSCYIHNNPVEAGLVTAAEEYRWSSARAYLGQKSEFDVSTDLILELCGGPRNYAVLLRESLALPSTENEHLPGAEQVRELWAAGSVQFRDKLESIVERRSDRRKHHRRPKGLSLEKIWVEVSHRTGIGREDISGPSRSRRITKARAFFCALARREGIATSTIAGEIARTRPAVVQLADSFQKSPHRND